MVPAVLTNSTIDLCGMSLQKLPHVTAKSNYSGQPIKILLLFQFGNQRIVALPMNKLIDTLPNLRW